MPYGISYYGFACAITYDCWGKITPEEITPNSEQDAGLQIPAWRNSGSNPCFHPCLWIFGASTRDDHELDHRSILRNKYRSMFTSEHQSKAKRAESPFGHSRLEA
ncbi:hypothetical protein F2Q69_00029459 [Brassica cretica]|uniref:Uncharacterized protein n=1 Tax=Brassica cretica TaxID=69181 RepID=A0A8S9RXD2_BRACR|nr:hypothetical protein F2Q69_00029459 [Brassica cretica]